MCRKYIFTALLLFLFCHSEAAYRLWEGKDGSATEAEFVGESGSSIVLRKRDKSIMRVPKSELCTRDVQYVEIKTPPDLKVKLDASIEKGKARCLVSVEKVTTDAYEAPVTVGLYSVGFNRLQSEELVVLDSIEWSYESLPRDKFSENRKYERDFEYLYSYMNEIRPVKMVEIVGYVTKVFDAKGTAVTIEETENRLNKEAEEALGEALENVKLNDSIDHPCKDALQSGITAARLEYDHRGRYGISLYSDTAKFNFNPSSRTITGFGNPRGPSITPVPANVDAAFSYYGKRMTRSDQTAYYLCEGRCWRFNNSKLSDIGKVGEKVFEGISGEINAVAYVPSDGLYIFTAKQCHLYDLDRKSIVKTTPLNSRHWPGLPETIDAAAGLGSSIFFFSSGQYFNYSTKNKKVIAEGKIKFAGLVSSPQEPLNVPPKENKTIHQISKHDRSVDKIPQEQIAPTLNKIIADLAETQKGLKKLDGELAAKLTMKGGKSWTGRIVGIDGQWIEFTSGNSTKPIRLSIKVAKKIDFKISMDIERIREYINQQQYDALHAYLTDVLAPYIPYRDAKSNLNEMMSFVDSLAAALE